MNSVLSEQIAEILKPTLYAEGYELVEINLSQMGNGIVQLVAERLDAKNITIDDCVKITKFAAVRLDIEDIIKHAYNLEVTSPGIDRKLNKFSHFMQYEGFDANIEVRNPVDGRTKIKCQLGGVSGNEAIKFRMIENGEPKKEEVIVDFSNIRRAKLILTDKLISANQNNQT
tara:strand:+ start:1392 stop:1907 length:516 start_codon:yes stop_codon:yes gene_type:complete